MYPGTEIPPSLAAALSEVAIPHLRNVTAFSAPTELQSRLVPPRNVPSLRLKVHAAPTHQTLTTMTRSCHRIAKVNKSQIYVLFSAGSQTTGGSRREGQFDEFDDFDDFRFFFIQSVNNKKTKCSPHLADVYFIGASYYSRCYHAIRMMSEATFGVSGYDRTSVERKRVPSRRRRKMHFPSETHGRCGIYPGMMG